MSKIDPSQSIKRPDSPIANDSGSESKKRSREKVEVLEDTWLEALKCLSCPKWSKMRLVSPQFNVLIERNVSRLSLAIIGSAAVRLKERTKTEVKMIVMDSIIFPDEKDQWFHESGMTIDVPEDIQLSNANIGIEFKKNCCIDLCILGPAQEQKLTPYDSKTRPWFSGQQFCSEVLFYAEFSPHRNQFSWPSMAFFLKFLYDQSTYVKELSMYAFDKKLKEFLFPDAEKRFIRCNSFTLQVVAGASVEDLCESVSWLEKNVQADVIQFPRDVQYDESDICEAVSNFILGPSWINTSQKVNLGHVNELKDLFGALIKKFRTVAAVQGIFPIIIFRVHRRVTDGELYNLLPNTGIGKANIRKHNDSLEIHTVSYGANRMRVEFVRTNPTYHEVCCEPKLLYSAVCELPKLSNKENFILNKIRQQKAIDQNQRL